MSCDLTYTLVAIRICKIVRRSRHSEGVSWISWRPFDPGNCPLPVEFLYTKGIIPQVRRMAVVLGSIILTLIHPESPYFSHQLRCVVKCLVRHSLALKFILALGGLFWVTCCSNQSHEWRWWKTWMGLDFHHRTFGMFWNSLQSSVTLV